MKLGKFPGDGGCVIVIRTSTIVDGKILKHLSYFPEAYTRKCLVGTVVRRWTTVLEVVGSISALAKQRIKFYVSRPESDNKRSLVSLVAQVGNQWLRQVEIL